MWQWGEPFLTHFILFISDSVHCWLSQMWIVNCVSLAAWLSYMSIGLSGKLATIFIALLDRCNELICILLTKPTECFILWYDSIWTRLFGHSNVNLSRLLELNLPPFRVEVNLNSNSTSICLLHNVGSIWFFFFLFFPILVQLLLLSKSISIFIYQLCSLPFIKI